MRHPHPLIILAVIAAVATALPAFAEEPKPKKDESIVHVEPKEAAALLEKDDEKKKPVVLDVRTAAEFANGHLEGAKNIDFNAKDFADKLAKLDKDQPYLVHCRSGGRSARSLATFKNLGFKKIYHLHGGILAWEDAELPVVKR